jgi:hypothetical protein
VKDNIEYLDLPATQTWSSWIPRARMPDWSTGSLLGYASTRRNCTRCEAHLYRSCYRNCLRLNRTGSFRTPHGREKEHSHQVFRCANVSLMYAWLLAHGLSANFSCGQGHSHSAAAAASLQVRSTFHKAEWDQIDSYGEQRYRNTGQTHTCPYKWIFEFRL